MVRAFAEHNWIRIGGARIRRRALTIVRQALAELSCANRLGTIAPGAYRQNRVRFEYRLARLERKAGATLLDTLEADSRPVSNREVPNELLRL